MNMLGERIPFKGLFEATTSKNWITIAMHRELCEYVKQAVVGGWVSKQLMKDPGALYTHAGCATAGGPEGENLSNAGEKFPFVSSRRSSKCGKPANA